MTAAAVLAPACSAGCSWTLTQLPLNLVVTIALICACMSECVHARSFGRGGERGAARPEVLQTLLSTTERVIQEVDSVEYGLTDIQV
jgi:hypothetical protein